MRPPPDSKGSRGSCGGGGNGRMGECTRCTTSGSSGSVVVLEEDISLQHGAATRMISESPDYRSVTPICRQFWKADNFDTPRLPGGGGPSNLINELNHLHVHPKFLHSNATSHKWAFGAVAELVDNAVDEIRNGATFVDVRKILNPRDGSPALLIQDDGGGMDPITIRQCMSFGFSNKDKCAIGQYGNGFKASSMRLGADVIVFSRHMKTKTMTQSIGLLSYTLLRRMGHNRIVVPMVDYEFSVSTKAFEHMQPHGKESFSSNCSMLLQWSPYSTEEELLMQFDDVGHHGTKIVVYNLWLDDCGATELDFDSDAEDIWIRGNQEGKLTKPIFSQVANAFDSSLRVYLSILYLRLPRFFKIILRGRVVEPHNIADDLKFLQFIVYKPQLSKSDETVIVTTIGFLKEAPHVNIHGFNIYHRNRLILPFWRVLKNCKKGIVGVLEANCIQPTHNKQDFEKTSLFQRLEDRLSQMTMEYWRFHCHLIGYKVDKSPLVPHQESLASTNHNPPKQPDPLEFSCDVAEKCRTNSTVASVQNLEATTVQIAGSHKKQKVYNHLMERECEQGHATNSWNCMEEQFHNRTDNQVQHQEATSVMQKKRKLMQENKKLRLQLSELEKSVEALNQKVQQLRSELQKVHHDYRELSQSTRKDEYDQGADIFRPFVSSELQTARPFWMV